jgi:hypothetical protein
MGHSATTDITHVQVPNVVIEAKPKPDAARCFAQAHEAWTKHEYDAALASFDAALAAASDSESKVWALFWGAAVLEDEKRWAEAAARFARVHEAFPQHQLALPSAVGALRLWTFIDAWQRVGPLAATLLSYDAQLSTSEQVAAHGSAALAALAEGDDERARRELNLGRRIVERLHLDESSVWSRDMAVLYFAQGELRRHEAEAIGFADLHGDFAERFERRAQLVLDAQSAYLDSMRARDAHWSSYAGLRLSGMYLSLHDEVLRVPVPPEVPADKREVFAGAMHLRFLVLLEKGFGILDRTLAMTERTGESSERVDQARRQRAEIAARLERERAFIDSLPVSRADLARVLQEIQARQ